MLRVFDKPYFQKKFTIFLRDQILRVKGVDSTTAGSIPFLLVGNKSDLESNRQVSIYNGKS